MLLHRTQDGNDSTSHWLIAVLDHRDLTCQPLPSVQLSLRQTLVRAPKSAPPDGAIETGANLLVGYSLIQKIKEKMIA